jgi:hypothetical protein
MHIVDNSENGSSFPACEVTAGRGNDGKIQDIESQLQAAGHNVQVINSSNGEVRNSDNTSDYFVDGQDGVVQGDTVIVSGVNPRVCLDQNGSVAEPRKG